MASIRIRRVMIGLTIIGLGVAAYLTVVHYVGFGALACVGGHGGHSSCQTVQSSQWSKLAGVPVALLGLIGYIGILASLLVRDREGTRLATLGLTTIGFGFSAYLTYREAASIHAYLRMVPVERRDLDDPVRLRNRPVPDRRAGHARAGCRRRRSGA